MKTAFLVLGSVKTHGGEVRRLQVMAKQEFKAAVVLAKPGAGEGHWGVADCAVGCELMPTRGTAMALLNKCHGAGFKIIGVLPLAQEAAGLGALIASALGLPGAEVVAAGETGTGPIRHSWDHCPSHSWITAMESLAESPSVATQWVVPAPVAGGSRRRIGCAGLAAARSMGWQGGATHSVLGGIVKLCPGDMRIWDLAMHAYPRLNPWVSWMRWATGLEVPFKLEAENPAHCYAGLRLVRAPQSGVLMRLPRAVMGRDEVLSWGYTKAVGDMVTAEPRTREDFIGYVMMKSFDYEQLCLDLRRMAEHVSARIEVGVAPRLIQEAQTIRDHRH